MSQTILAIAAETPPNPAKRCEGCGVMYEPYARRATAQRFCGRVCSDRAWTEQRRATRAKRATRSGRILARLEEGPATTLDLMALGGSGWRSRLQELRDGKVDGTEYRITTENHGDYATYRLEGEG